MSLDDLPETETCTRCGHDSRWTILDGLCSDCRAADRRGSAGREVAP
jgi:NMD protein affecting ribosome stability and mRNA decay